MTKSRRFLYLLISGLIAVFLIIFFTQKVDKRVTVSHNCRFWGIIFSEMSVSLADTIRTHLDSLRALSASNPDGWGFGYFMTPDTQDLLAIITRGEPIAQRDPRYIISVENMIKYTEHCGIAHVRSGSSGPSSGIPDPHPFLRRSLSRDFEMILAHNGNIPVKQLLALINMINPLYIELNPPDYSPDYVDSDLYAIFMMEIIDTYLDLTIEECIQTAITKLDSAIGLSAAKFNFVMSDGTKIWALNYDRSLTERSALYLYPNVSESAFWVAASVPLDTLNIFWAAVPNSTLVVLYPNESPRFIRILNNEPLLPPALLFNIICPNPFKGTINIQFQIPDNANADLRIYDATGRLITEFNNLTNPRLTCITWHGTDTQQREVPSGIYYCVLDVDEQSYTRKLILIE
ncbi:MAG: T9SS type A sorting domain-containing protein [bacterium]